MRRRKLSSKRYCELVDEMSCHLVLTLCGGARGPARRDASRRTRPLHTDREKCTDFGERCPRSGTHLCEQPFFPAVGVIRKQALILNLRTDGQNRSEKKQLEGVKRTMAAR
ncbi:hypothetical protein KCP77_22550 [Salmonella enterica subsp. enterica]|nr:hypothetical protein KCP77_22550 [Salmonella enterica subsp. enterica]